MKNKNIEKILIKEGFTILDEVFVRENSIGYINKGIENIVAVPVPFYLEDYERRYYLAKALTYYLNKDEEEYFKEIEKGYDSQLDEETINMLVSDKKFLKYYKKYKGDLDRLSELFETPKKALIQKTLTLHK